MPRTKRRVSPNREVKVKRAAIYSRVSTRGQGETGLSLDHQTARCQDYCRSKTWQVVETYQDIASAKDLDRPDMQRLLSAAEEKKFDVVVGLKLDRLSRVPKDFYNLFEQLSELDVNLVTVDNSIDTTSSEGRMLVGILLQFAAFERELGIERTRAAMRELALQGRPGGGRPPLGYDRVDKAFVTNKDEAEIIQQIYSRYLMGVGPTKISRELYELGYRTKLHTNKDGSTRGGKEFTKKHIHDIITNPIYSGYLFARGEMLPGNHSPIIEKEAWDQAQRQVRLNADKKNLGQSQHDRHLLNGLLRCGMCQRILSVRAGTSKSKKRYSYYKCVGASTSTTGDRCKNVPLNTKKLETIIVALIKQIATSDEFFEAVSGQIRTSIDEESVARLKSEIARASAKEVQLTEKMNNLIDLLADGKATNIEEVDARINVIKSEREGIQNRTSELQRDLDAAKRDVPTAQELREVYKEFDLIWETLTQAEKRDILRLLVDEIEVTNPKNAKKGNISVTLFHEIPALSLTKITQGSHFSTFQLRRRDLNSQPSD